MKVDELKIERKFIEIIKDIWGIEELYPPQAEAVKHVLAGKNVVVSMPTASGKTLIGYIGTFKMLGEGKKVTYLCPLRALASEKYNDLKEVLSNLGYSVILSLGDYWESTVEVSKAEVRIMTYEKFDSMVRRSPDILYATDLLIVDEIHFLGDETRGSTLELLLTKFKYLNPRTQFIGLSATIGNIEEIAQWLDAEVVKSEWRPIPLYKSLFYDGDLIVYRIEREKPKNVLRTIELKLKQKDIIHLIEKIVIEEKAQALMFVPTRRDAEDYAELIRRITRRVMMEDPEFVFGELNKEFEKIKRMRGEITKGVKKIFRMLRDGVAFHHAGLDYETRSLIEELFRAGKIKVIVATPTLSMGVNTPARYVIIEDIFRPELTEKGWERVPLTKMEVEQMLGRAGRPRYDEYGVGIINVPNSDVYEFVAATYIGKGVESVYSRISDPKVIRKEIVGIFKAGIVEDLNAVYDYFEKSFFEFRSMMIEEKRLFKEMEEKIKKKEKERIKLELTTIERRIEKFRKMIKSTFEWLDRHEFIEQKDMYWVLTDKGDITAVMYIDPMTAEIINHFALILEKRGAYPTDFQILHAITVCPDCTRFTVAERDLKIIEREISKEVTAFSPEQLVAYYGHEMAGTVYDASLKTALVLRDWVNERPIDDIVAEYGIMEGDLKTLLYTAGWIAHAGASVLNVLGYEELSRKFSDMEKRIKYGVSEELLELVSLYGVGRVRARRLYDAGYTNLEMVAYARISDLMKVTGVGKRLAESIKKQAENLIAMRSA